MTSRRAAPVCVFCRAGEHAECQATVVRVPGEPVPALVVRCGCFEAEHLRPVARPGMTSSDGHVFEPPLR